MPGKWIPIAGALLAAIGVGLGAFGAHGLEDLLRRLGYEADLSKRLGWYETAVRYQLFHALALLIVAALSARSDFACGSAAWLFVIGIALFSGSLYAMTFLGEGWRKLGMVTPLGGLALIAGWLALAVAAARRTPPH
jgi:uncharacterized membrane protein YgdD (TMEM256/DUF423 family)